MSVELLWVSGLQTQQAGKGMHLLRHYLDTGFKRSPNPLKMFLLKNQGKLICFNSVMLNHHKTARIQLTS